MFRNLTMHVLLALSSSLLLATVAAAKGGAAAAPRGACCTHQHATLCVDNVAQFECASKLHGVFIGADDTCAESGAKACHRVPGACCAADSAHCNVTRGPRECTNGGHFAGFGTSCSACAVVKAAAAPATTTAATATATATSKAKAIVITGRVIDAADALAQTGVFGCSRGTVALMTRDNVRVAQTHLRAADASFTLRYTPSSATEDEHREPFHLSLSRDALFHTPPPGNAALRCTPSDDPLYATFSLRTQTMTRPTVLQNLVVRCDVANASTLQSRSSAAHYYHYHGHEHTDLNEAFTRHAYGVSNVVAIFILLLLCFAIGLGTYSYARDRSSRRRDKYEKLSDAPETSDSDSEELARQRKSRTLPPSVARVTRSTSIAKGKRIEILDL